MWYMVPCVQFSIYCIFFFFNDTATTEIYTLSLHDALPILMEKLRSTSLAIYAAAAAHALERGIIIADTKFEFGIPSHIPQPTSGLAAAPTHILIDEALTPDSSRFWPATD